MPIPGRDAQDMWNLRLYNAARSGNSLTIEEARRKGADVNSVNPATHATPLQIAVSLNRPVEVVETLLRLGGDPDKEAPTGYTATSMACTSAESGLLPLLLEYGGDPNRQRLDKDGRRDKTPLHDMAIRGNLSHTRRLLKAGADPYIRDAKGDTARRMISREDLISVEEINAALMEYEGLPVLPDAGPLTHAMLLAKRSGICPLDNPAVWRRWPEITRRLEESGSAPPDLAELLQEGREGMPYIGRAIEARMFGPLVRTLNERDETVDMATLTAHPKLAGAAFSPLVARAVFSNPNSWEWSEHKRQKDRRLLKGAGRDAVAETERRRAI